jgi:hypothetical protein
MHRKAGRAAEVEVAALRLRDVAAVAVAKRLCNALPLRP